MFLNEQYALLTPLCGRVGREEAESRRPSRASRRSPLASNSTMDIGKIVDGLFGELFAPVGCCMKRNKTEDNPLFDGK